jgi:hypothetical protein
MNIKQIVYQGQTIDISAIKVLGSGGEANIIKHGNIAFKIYHDPTPERATKLQDFLKKKFVLPSNVLAPLDVVTARSKVVGFAMNLAEPGCKDFINLFDKDFRAKQQINSNNIATLFLDTLLTKEEIHRQNLVIGDFNDLNELFTRAFKSVFLDFDSIQFDNYPCIVGTDTYIDPSLYGVDLTKKPCFTRKTDDYSFAVMLFRAFLLVHPYGGTHNKYGSIFSRAENKIWAFDKGVIYPKIGRKPDILPDELLQYFSGIFCKGDRSPLSLQLMQSLQNSFVECKSCGVYFSHTRQKCPQCQVVAPVQAINLSNIIAKKQIGTEKCEAETLFHTNGVILFAKVIDNNEVVVVDFDGTNTNCHIITNGLTHSVILYMGLNKDFEFSYFKPYCLVIADNEDLMIINVKDNKIKPITKTSTTLFSGKTVFACSKEKLYRLTNTMIMAGYVVESSQQFLDQNVTAAMQDQTSVYVGQNDFGLGFYRIFNDYKYFTFSSKGRFEIESGIDNLPGQLIDMDVRVSVNTLLLLRKNLHQGRTYSHWHIINDQGQILENKSEESISSDLLRTIHGKELVGSSIVHATDAGIVIEKHGVASLKVSTAEFVDSESKLLMYRQGIVSISDKSVVYLKLI